MKATILTHYGNPEDLTLQEIPTPTPQPDEVLIKVHAASVNDWDWGLTRGTPFYIRLLCGFREPKIRIPGVDVAGVIESVGQGVTNWKPGDRVFGDLSEHGFGAFAEYTCAKSTAIAKAPDAIPFIKAAAIPHAATLARQALVDVAHLQPTDRLLINGAGGGVGTLAVQLAAHLGVRDITGVDSATKHNAMRSVGYHQVVDFQKTDFTATGERYDVILDTRTTRPLRDYKRALTPTGRYVTVGGETGKLLHIAIFGRIASMLGTRSYRVLALKTNKDLDTISGLCNERTLVPVIDRVFPLEQAPAAIRRFGGGRHVGKIIIDVSNNADPHPRQP